MKKVILIMVVVFLFSSTSAYAASVDREIYYTKKTTLSYPKTYTFRFSLWDDPASTNPANMVWSEEKSIALTSKKITTYLGDTTALNTADFSQQLYIQVDRYKNSAWVQVGTRDKLGVVPYALSTTVPLSLEGSVSFGSIISGSNSSSSGYGVYGEAAGNIGIGVYGHATANGNVNNYGGLFIADGDTGIGVYSYATANGAAQNYGGYFIADGDNGRGVFAYAAGTSGYGVRSYGGLYDFYAAGPGTDYGTSSSVRWKRNIVEIENALGKVMNLRGVYFDWDEEHGGQHDMGFIAEEVGKVIPEVVGFEPDGVYATGVDYGAVTPMLVQAIKEQQRTIEAQKEEIKNLKEDFAQIKAMLNKK